jgi:phenylpropionate dioxygenase-like ring-hydroxylating dioxygenase large terminal subunit
MKPKTNGIREIAPLIPEGLPRGLRNYWYPVLQSEELPEGKPVGLTVLGEPLVAWRGPAGEPNVLSDRCPHRSVKLSLGRVFDGRLQCILHGLRFDGGGRCVLVPWETEEAAEAVRPTARAYLARELGGYVWAYIGDTAAFPPPPLEAEVPEELLRPEEFVWFRLPTEVWNANWLLTIDGSDAYHAVVLHAMSQPVANKAWSGGAAEHVEVPLAERRMRIVKTSHGIRSVSVDKEGRPLHHGHFTVDVKGDRFVLPCIHTNPIQPAPGVAPYASRLWQFPIDEQRTQIVRYAVWRARNQAERDHARQVFEDLALPRLRKVSAEDAMVAEAQGDLVTARSQEYLLTPDVDLVKLRRSIRNAFVAQAVEESRVAVPEGALVFPV